MEGAPLVVLTGPPGAGKTTVSQLLAERFDGGACVLESDWWWTTLVPRRLDPWLPEADRQNRTVVRSYAAAAAAMAAGGYATVLEGVVGPWVLGLVAAEARDVELHYAVLRPGLDEVLRRATGRAGQERVPGHPALVDEGVVAELWHQFADLGDHESHVLETGGLTAAESADLLWARLGDGSLRL